MIPALRTGSPFTLGFSGDDLSPAVSNPLDVTFMEVIYSPEDPAITSFDIPRTTSTYTGDGSDVTEGSSAAESVEVFSDRAKITPETADVSITAVVIVQVILTISI